MYRTFSKRLGPLCLFLLVLFPQFLRVYCSQIKNVSYNAESFRNKFQRFATIPKTLLQKNVKFAKFNESEKSILQSESADQLTATSNYNFPFSSYHRDSFNIYVPVSSKYPTYSRQRQQSYYSNVINEYYPNGTSVAHLSITPSHHFIKNDHNPRITHFQQPDGSGGKEIRVEANGGQTAVVAASVWYLIMAVLLHSNSVHSEPSYCSWESLDYYEELPVWHVYAEKDPSSTFHFGDFSLQTEVYEMFSPYRSHSWEDNSIEMPDLSHVSSMCSKNEFFHGMNHDHMKAVEMVTYILMDQSEPREVIAMAKALRHSPDINPQVWYGALMRASHDRADMGGIVMPSPLDAMPDRFIPGDAIERGLNSLQNRQYSRSRKRRNKCIIVDGSVGTDNGIENVLWYFREDVMLNSHHWYWHLTFPLVTTTQIDRRGELFYYTHRSMTTRYNIERLCNGMEFARPMEIFPGAPIEPGFFAHLTEFNAGMPWTDRPPNTPISDIFRQNAPDPSTRFVIPIENWIRSRDRILKAIDTGFFVTRDGGRMRIPHYEGIDILGNTVEAIDLSINPRFYDPDGYHNNGHRVIGYSVDPEYRLELPPGPMADPATAMRDPIFYRWHTNINNIFGRYKSTLKPYQPVGGEFPLLWRGVEVEDVSVVAKDGRRNYLHTFFGRRKFDLSLGLAFNISSDDDYDGKPDPLTVCATHLDHEEFDYKIVVNRKPCAKSKSGIATVRIFLAPKYDLYGNRFTMKEQRPLFVHLDLFTVKLKVGRNIISRRSIDSALTIPFKDSLRQLQSNLGNQNNPNCGCGWPHNLLLPRGTPDGMPFDLFVMVTNGDEDIVIDNDNSLPAKCGSAFLYCGIQNRRFPDFRPMGYPFDRDLYKISGHCSEIAGFSIWSKVCSWLSVDGKVPRYLEDYTRGITNMGFSRFIIEHIPD